MESLSSKICGSLLKSNPLQASSIRVAKKTNGVVCKGTKNDVESQSLELNRRAVLATVGLGLLTVEKAEASTSVAVAGRIPGLSEPDDDGWRTYTRPAGKSGGHGVGWSELIPYSFKVPDSWEEVPVSIADLGGTEIDLRFSSSKQGNLSVVVAPILRFADGLGDDVTIEMVGTPEKVIYAFGPELTGKTVEGLLKDMKVKSVNGRTYYQYEVDPHVLVSATAAGNRMYIMALTASGRQWKKHSKELLGIVDTFSVG